MQFGFCSLVKANPCEFLYCSFIESAKYSPLLCIPFLVSEGNYFGSRDIPTLEHHLLCVYLVAPSCPTVCNPMDSSSPPGSSVPGISQARILEWVAISFSRGSSQPRDQTHVSSVSCRWILYLLSHQGSQGSWLSITTVKNFAHSFFSHSTYILSRVLYTLSFWLRLLGNSLPPPPDYYSYIGPVEAPEFQVAMGTSRQ